MPSPSPISRGAISRRRTCDASSRIAASPNRPSSPSLAELEASKRHQRRALRGQRRRASRRAAARVRRASARSSSARACDVRGHPDHDGQGQGRRSGLREPRPGQPGPGNSAPELPKDWKERSRQARFLQYRGFSTDHIRAVLEGDPDDESGPIRRRTRSS